MEKTKNENALRTLRNLSTIASWNTTLNQSEVEYLFSEHSDTVFCNGMLRQIKADMITPNVFKIYTISI